MKSLRTKITALTVIAIIIAMTIATLLGAVAIRSIGKDSAEELLLLLCQTGQKNLDHYFESVEQSVEMVTSFVNEDLAMTEPDQLAAHIDRTRKIFMETAENTAGVLTYYYRIDPAVSDEVKGFWYTNLDGEGFEEHEVTDITQYDTEDTSQLVWFTVPKATGKGIWLSPYITDNLDVKVISYNEPVYWNGTFIGVVGIEIDYTTMAEQVNSIQLYKDGYAFINDSDGYLVYHPRLTDDELEVERNREAPYGMIEDNTLIRYTYNGVEKEGVWLPLSNDMRLNVTVPVSEINSEWHKWINETVIVSIILLILFIVLTMVLSGRITKPLQDLTKAAEQVVEGNYDVSLNYKGEDEVGILSRAFNHLTSHLQAYIRDLKDLAYGDALTAVRNKGAFDIYMKNMQAQLEDPSQETPEFAVCFFDCNNLKQINDQHGHDKGDLYLKRACKTICQIFSHSPVFRIGGDEFAAILQNKDYESRKDLIRIFDQRCFDLRAVGKDPWERVDVARGMAVYDPKKDTSVEDVVRRADERMYENKRVRKGKPE